MYTTVAIHLTRDNISVNFELRGCPVSPVFSRVKLHRAVEKLRARARPGRAAAPRPRRAPAPRRARRGEAAIVVARMVPPKGL